MDETWGGESYDSDFDGSGLPCVRVNGDDISLNEGDLFKDVIKKVSTDAGFGKFRVFYNGLEIKPSEAPLTIAAEDKLEVRPYDVPGLS